MANKDYAAHIEAREASKEYNHNSVLEDAVYNAVITFEYNSNNTYDYDARNHFFNKKFKP